jgi:outer membrane protein insertion porin family
MKRSLLLSFAALLLSTSVQAADFAVDDIRIEGLQQVEPGIVFRNFPILRGDQVDDRRLNEATKDLFDSGYFDDVELLRDGDVLVVRVKERPSVALITLDGNNMIKEEQLRDALKRAGLDEGEIYRRSALDQIRLELLRVYNDAGRYTSQIDTEVEELSGNRVSLNIKIKEGREAVVKKINIIGNNAFSDEELQGLFDTGLTGLFSWWTDNDKYAKEKLSADVERLRSYYLDRGYLKFVVNSTDVSISPDQKQVFISINVTEGEQYSYGKVELVGAVEEHKAELESALALVEGELFSRRDLVDAQKALGDKMSSYGYLFSRVSPLTDIKEANQVDVKFFIEPGPLTYVRRINIRGNSTTADEVIRREIPQMEGSLAKSGDVEKAKTNLGRLGYFAKVDVKVSPVAEAADQVDLDVIVEESMLGQISAGVGYSSSEGVGLQASLSQDNFLGTGTKFGFNFNSTDIVKDISLTYDNPYYTLDGVGRGFEVYVSKKDFSAATADASDYNLNRIGGSVNFSYPIDESQRLKFGVGVDSTDIVTQNQTGLPQVIQDFLDARGYSYLTYRLTGSWISNKLNNGLLPTRGSYNSITTTLAVPGGDLSYVKATYTGKYFLPLDRNDAWVLGLRTYNGYARTLDGGDYPFFENFFAGGLNTVRGYTFNSLGPRERVVDPTTSLVSAGDNLGGTALLSGTVELIFPMPFVDDKNTWRTSLFLDAGNVFVDDCSNYLNCSNLGDLKASAGIGITWMTPIGPLSISTAKALNASSYDVPEQVQFAIGRTF